MSLTDVVTFLVFFPIALAIVVGGVRYIASNQPEFAHTETLSRSRRK